MYLNTRLVLKLSAMAGIGTSLILGIPSIEQLSHFLHSCIDNLVGKTGSSFNNINSDVDWSQEDYEQARKFIQNVYKLVVSNADYNMENALCELGPDKIESIRECYEIRKAEIQHAVTNECLAKLDRPLVTDYDWKLKWIIGSSTLSSVREPLLQMDLRTSKIDSDDIGTKDAIKFEMNLAETNSFIDQLEKCLAVF